MTRSDLRGLVAFAVTPTDDRGIDGDALCRHVDHLVASGVDAVALFGSAGAIGSFTEAERCALTETVLGHVRGRVPIVVGTGAMTTAETIRLSVHAERLGAAACLVVPITYWLLDDREVVQHYAAVDAAIQTPLFVYNNPVLTHVDLRPELLARLCELPNVRYLKESAPSVARVGAVRRATGDRLRIFAGRDDFAFEAIVAGADGMASGLANIVPRACRELFDRLARDDFAKARALRDELAPLNAFVLSNNLAAAYHAALEILGRPVGRLRPPMLPLVPADVARLETLLRSLEAWS